MKPVGSSLKRTRTTRHPWLIACDANVFPEDFEGGLLFQREQMHVVVPKEAYTCRSKGPKVNGLKESMITSLRVAVSKERSCRWRWWMILNQDQSSVFCGQKRKGGKGMDGQKLPKLLPRYSGGGLPGRSTKGKGKEEGEVNEDGGERRIRSQIAQEVVAGIIDGIKEAVQKPAGQSFLRRWGVLTDRTEEEEESWREGDQIVLREEEQQLEEILERRRMEGSSLKLEVMQKSTGASGA